jgi:hypothetical protein
LAAAAVLLFAWLGPPAASLGWLLSGIAILAGLGTMALISGVIWVPRGFRLLARADTAGA